MDDQRLLTLKEACAILRIGRSKMFDLLDKHALPHVRIGRKIFFEKADLDQFIKKQKVK